MRNLSEYQPRITPPYFQSAYNFIYVAAAQQIIKVFGNSRLEFRRRFDLKRSPNSAGQAHEQDAKPAAKIAILCMKIWQSPRCQQHQRQRHVWLQRDCFAEPTIARLDLHIGETLGCLQEIEATTPGTCIRMQKWSVSLRCKWQQQGFLVRDCGANFHIDQWIFHVSSSKDV